MVNYATKIMVNLKMQLYEWLKIRKISIKKLSEKLECAPGTVISIRDGHLPNICKNLKMIEDLTWGEVTIKEMIEYSLSQEEEVDTTDA